MSDYSKGRNRKPHPALGDAFGAWERRGRGWAVWDFAVELEPPFSPIRMETQAPPRVLDDARLPKGIGGLFGADRKTLPAAAQPPPNDDPVIEPPPSLYRAGDVSELLVLLPEGSITSPATVGQFLQSLGGCRTPIAFELVADAEAVRLQMACDAAFAEVLKARLRGFFGDITVVQSANPLRSHFAPDRPIAFADFGLAKSFALPLNTFRGFEPDPLTGMISSLAGLKPEERAVFQVLFQQTRHRWADELQRITAHPDAGSLPILNPRAINEKLASPFFAVSIRLAAQSATEQQSWQLLRNVGGNVSVFSDPAGNELIALSNEGLPENNHLLSLVNRTSYRSGMLLNCSELSSLVHPPSSFAGSEKLKRADTHTRAAPANASGGTLVLGANAHNGETRTVTLSTEQRLKHAHVIGSTGSGKSTMLVRMMIQDAEQGRGFAAVDPHGDLIDSVLDRIPDHRVDDVIVFDPADQDHPVGFNVLAAHSELEKTLIASDMVAVFRKFSTSWGDVMTSVLSNAVLAFLESDRGGSLLDLKRFLVERNFREEFLPTVRDEEVRYYWQHEFAQIRGKPYAPLLTRLDTFLRSRLIRHIVAQKRNRLDFRRIMDGRKILLARLSHGAMGIENAYLLGCLLVSKFYQAALSRQDVGEANRLPYFLYLDEAHHFVTESMNQILSGARKFGLGVTVSHQQLRQFESGEADILASVLSNTYARICFRLDEDAEKLAKGFSFFTAEHLRNLGVGEAICRFEQARYDFNLRTQPLEPIAIDVAKKRRAAIIENSRRLYAKPRAEVEEESRSGPTTQVASIPLTQQPSADPVIVIAPAAVEAPPAEPSTGRGGAHHRELQSVIARMGEIHGFAPEIEKELPGGGRVDVSLSSGAMKIACEVCVTTDSYETANTRKCLEAGYDFVVTVVSNRKKIPSLRSRLSASVGAEFQDRIRVCDLPDLLAFLRGTSPGNDAEGERRRKKPGQRLSFGEACELLGKSSSTLYRWVREGRVPFYRVGREYEFDRDELLLIGKHDLSGKRKATVKLSPLTIEKSTPKTKKQQDERYRKLLGLDKMDGPLSLHTRRGGGK